MSRVSESPIRIGNFSGYLGDRRSAIDEVMAGDPVDVLTGDYLAELTLAALATGYRANPEGGYVGYFVQQLEPHLSAIAERGMKVVTNAGGFSPAALADAIRSKVSEQGLTLRVAHVTGDSILDRLDGTEIGGHPLLDPESGGLLSDPGVDFLAANAYLGAFGIVAALRHGADIVVTGRVTDASLVVGPAAWWHDWKPDDFGPLAGAVTAGHVIECGPQVTGGNFSGFTTVPANSRPGFPIAEIAADGSTVITKHRGDGGMVSVDTVTAQLVYEIQGPKYLNPDVVVHFDTIEVSHLAADRVQIGPVTGSAPPRTAKVALFGSVGWQISQMVYCTAPDIDAKVELLRRQLHEALGEVDELDITTLGAVASDPATQWEATLPIRIMAASRRRESLRSFAGVIFGLYLQGFPGIHLDGGAQRLGPAWPRIGYWPALIDVDALAHKAVLDDGSEVDADRTPVFAAASDLTQPEHAEPTGIAPAGREMPLGAVAHARSGDKGGDCNVGVWVSDASQWEWLRETMTSANLRLLVAEAKDLDIVRHELPHLRAVHFVVKGLLGAGGSTNMRVDSQGKSVGEYLRSKHVRIPDEVLDARS